MKVVDALVDGWRLLDNGRRAVHNVFSSFVLLLFFSSSCAPLIQWLNKKLLVTHADHPSLETQRVVSHSLINSADTHWKHNPIVCHVLYETKGQWRLVLDLVDVSALYP